MAFVNPKELQLVQVKENGPNEYRIYRHGTTFVVKLHVGGAHRAEHVATIDMGATQRRPSDGHTKPASVLFVENANPHQFNGSKFYLVHKYLIDHTKADFVFIRDTWGNYSIPKEWIAKWCPTVTSDQFPEQMYGLPLERMIEFKC